MYSSQARGMEGGVVDAARSDRTSLLRFVLEQKDVWSRLSLPDGVTSCDDLDLDAVSVPELLAQLRVPGSNPNLRDYGRSGGCGGAAGTAPGTSSPAGATTLMRSPPAKEKEEQDEEQAGQQTRPSLRAGATSSSSDDRVPDVVSLESLLKSPSPALRSHVDSSKRSVALIQPIPGSAGAGPTTPTAAATPKTYYNSNAVSTPFSPTPFTPSASASASASIDRTGIAAPIPELILPEIRGGGVTLRDPEAIAQCAYEVFAACVGDTLDDDLVDTVRVALEIPSAMGNTTAALLAPHMSRIKADVKGGGGGGGGGAGLRVHLRLMSEAAGCGVLDGAAVISAFGGDGASGVKARTEWVRRQAAVLSEALWTVHDAEYAAAAAAAAASSSSNGEGAATAATIRPHGHHRDDIDEDDVTGHTAHVGAVIEEVSRLMELVNPDNLAAQGGAEALAATVEAVLEMVEGALDAAGDAAWRYPTQLAGGMYAQLLRAAFDPLEEGNLADDAEAIIASLTGPGGAGRVFGVSGAAHRAIFAWSLARHHQQACCGGGLFDDDDDNDGDGGGGGGGGGGATPGERAYSAALEAEGEDEEAAYRLLATASRALSSMRTGSYGDVTGAAGGAVGGGGGGGGDTATLTLVHAALGPLVWWAEGSLGDFYTEANPPAGPLARGVAAGAVVSTRGPSMTPDGFSAVLRLGVAAARARGATAAAAATGGKESAAAAAVGEEAGRAFAARVCKHSVGEAYARLRLAADKANDEAAPGGAAAAAAAAGTGAANNNISIAPGMKLLAEGCAALADAYEAHLSSHVVSAAGPAAANAAPAAIAECFSADLCAWLDGFPPLDNRAKEALWAAQDMQNAVAAAVMGRGEGKVGGVGDGDDVVFGKGAGVGAGAGAGAGGFDFEPLKLEARVAPLIFQWVAGRLDVLRRTMQRSIQNETWRSAASVGGGPGTNEANASATAHSAVELMRAAWDTLEAFWKLDLPAPVSALRALTEGLDGAFQEYAEAMTGSLGQPESFAPPFPRLTRYKKDVVEAMRKTFEAEKSKAQAQGQGTWWGDFDEGAEWGEGPERFAVGKFPKGLSEGAEGAQGVTATIPQLCCRAASLHFLLRRLKNIEKEVPLKYAAMQRGVSGGGGGGADHANASSSWLEGLLDGARQTLASCALKVADYIAYKTVFWDLRQLFIDGLYRVGVAGGEKLDAVVGRLEAALCQLADHLPGPGGKEARDEIALALLRASVRGWMHVMLDGGPGRVFGAEDNDALEEDLACLKDMFIAGGDGVPEETVEAETKRANQLLMVMALDTTTVCENYAKAEARDTARGVRTGARGEAASPGGAEPRTRARTGGGGAGATTTSTTTTTTEEEEEGVFESTGALLRVLCHREDRNASKYLKSKMSLPKK